MKVRYFFLMLLGLCLAFAGYRYIGQSGKGKVMPIPLSVTPKPKPLLAYTFENLKKIQFKKSPITMGNIISETGDSEEQLFYFYVPSKPGDEPTLKVSGVMNRPKKNGAYPLIIMFRGFIPDESYVPGAGTQHVAEVLAKNGYITLAPDFLGFAESDKPSTDSFEARFQTYTTALTLVSSLSDLNAGLDASYSGSLNADIARVGLWGHSNGGHIALSVLSITGADFPSVLWAPVSKPFPYSILYYSDEADDNGKAMRKVLSEFEQDYDADLFSPVPYYSWIKAPLEFAQGTADREVPLWWTEELVDNLKKDQIDATYNIYPGADHNMLPSGWSAAVTDSVAFFKTSL